MTWGPPTQGPGASRCSFPPSLYLKTWGRVAGRQGGVGDAARARRVAHIPTLTRTGPGPAASRGLTQGHSSVKSLSMSM